MAVKTFGLAFILLLTQLLGCSADTTPQSELEAAVERLQESLENKRNSAVMEQLHDDFSAQQMYDRDWAKRTMTLLFLRHKNVRVLALSKQSQIDPVYQNIGRTQAQIALTGAEGLIPDSARHYSEELEWWRVDDQWLLARLNWQ